MRREKRRIQKEKLKREGNNNRLIDSDDDLEILEDGTLLTNNKTKKNKKADKWLKSKSELIGNIEQLMHILLKSKSQYFGLQFPKRH